jgi:hypothetical protein
MLGLGRVERTPEQRTAAKMFKNIPEAKRSVEKLRKRGMDDVKNEPQRTGVRDWRKMISDSDDWNRS